MKKHFPKWLKATLISLASVVGLVLIAAIVALYLVFTPARLTSIVNSLSDKFITCNNHFESVNLSLFRTFPNVGLEVEDAVLINPTQGFDHDTLAHIGSLTVGINLRDYLKNKEIKVQQVVIDHLCANAFIGEDGTTNFDIFPSSSDTTTEESEPFAWPDTVSLSKFKISNINLSLTDKKDGLMATLTEADLKASGLYTHENADAQMCFSASQLVCLMDSAQLDATLHDISLALDGAGTLQALQGQLSLKVDQAQFSLNGEPYVNEALRKERHLLKIDLPYTANLDSMDFTLKAAALQVADCKIGIDGTTRLSPLCYDVAFRTNTWRVAEVLPLLPASIAQLLPQDMTYDANLQLQGTAKDNLIDAHLALDKGSYCYPSALPYPIQKIDADIDAHLDLSDGGLSSVDIHSLHASASKSTLALSGHIDDLLGKMLTDVRLQGNLHLPDVKPFLPDSLGLEAKGTSHIDLHAKTNLEQLSAVDIKNMKVDGTLDFSHLDVNLQDDILAQSPRLKMEVHIPAKHATSQSFKEILSARITSANLKAQVLSSNIDGTLENADIEAGLCDFMDDKQPFSLTASLKSGKLIADIDSINARISEPDIQFEMVPRKDDPAKVRYQVRYNSSALSAQINDSLSLDMAGLSIAGTANYDSTRSNVLQQWGPDLNIDLKRAYIHHSSLDYTLQIPDIKFNYKPERCEIASANIVFGNSDYYLSGAVTGLEQWLSHEDMLHGDLHFTSNYTNVDDLLDALSGLGSDPDTLAQQRQEDNVKKEANPFIVPKDVDFTLHTRIKDCTAFGNELQELAGDIMINDGIAVLDQVGFVCKAATMQLTAMYRTPRVNHIFLGLDFHLLDIGISELIDMIPMVDTIVPMLAALDGNADFHLCAETYVDAFYQPKYSTLRGAASIKGDSLVVLDNETFNTISKLLMFKKSTRNVIDSLDVQLTVFRKEVELFPFLIAMDKYQVVAAGRHNLDMNYDYHLEIIKSPLPTRLAVDALGVMPKIGIKLSKCRYADLYQPAKRNDLEERTIAFKRLIHESLEANVRESTRQYRKQ